MSNNVKVLRGLAKKVSKARIARKMTISDLSRISGVSQSAISKIEKKKSRPVASTLGKLSKALGIDLTGQCGVPASNKLGRRLKALRMAAGLTQREVAELVGLSPNALSFIEIGRVARPRPDTLAKLAELFDADLVSVEADASPCEVIPFQKDGAAKEAEPVTEPAIEPHACACVGSSISEVASTFGASAVQIVRAMVGKTVCAADDQMVVRLVGSSVEEVPAADMNLLGDIQALPEAQREVVSRLIESLKAAPVAV